MKEIIDAYRRLLQFEGRSSIREYLCFSLYYLAVVIVIMIVEDDSGLVNEELAFGPVMWIYVALNFLPNLALTVRRLHDSDLSGLWFLIMFVPFFGPLLLLGLCLRPGTKGENRFGPSLFPLETSGLEQQDSKDSGAST